MFSVKCVIGDLYTAVEGFLVRFLSDYCTVTFLIPIASVDILLNKVYISLQSDITHK